MDARAWHTEGVADVAATLRTDLERGLAEGDARERFRTAGPNELPAGPRESFARTFFRQFRSPLIYALLGASVIVFALGELSDGFVILFVLVFNATVGAIQEGRAARTLAALRRFSETSATVLRDGKERALSDVLVVPGDILVVREGEKIAADARLFDAEGLFIDESALTGESGGVMKRTKRLRDAATPLPDRANMVFKGTYVLRGVGRAVAVATGGATEVGKISVAIQTIDTEIPLTRDIRALSKRIVWAVAILSTVLFGVGTALGEPAAAMFLTAVSVTVSLIPEGLPIVLTLILARGVWRMAKQRALVKRLQAIEALGEAQVIAVDKTGTITKNEMVVRKAVAGGETFDVAGNGYEAKGEAFKDGVPALPLEHPTLAFLGKLAALSVRASASFSEETKRWRISGDPTEAAIGVFSEKVGFRSRDLLAEHPLLIERPFDYKEKYHAFLYRVPRGRLLAVSGAPESLLARSRSAGEGGTVRTLTARRREAIMQRINELSRDGMRVIALAYAKLPPRAGRNATFFKTERLVFAGLLAIEDSLREGAAEAVQDAARAGIEVVMASGDHPATAAAIARKVGIFHRGDAILTGEEIERMNDAELAARLEGTTVFARVTPKHKLRIVEGYRRRGETIAMTGDGVNDAPSLVAADLGIAMGVIGTEVAKEAADIVLLDDNFRTIVSAVREGRNVFQVIRKVLTYLFSTSTGEFLTIVSAIAIGFPLPLLPVQILWLNLVTDPFAGIALALESEEPGLLDGSFTRPRRLVDGAMAVRMIVVGVPMVLGTLFLFGGLFRTDLPRALTVSLTALAVFQWLNVFNCRSEDRSAFSPKNPANRALAASLGAALLFQLAVVYVPFLEAVFHTVPLTLADWAGIVAVGLSVILAEEARKFFVRRAARI